MPKDKSELPKLDSEWKAVSRDMLEKFVERAQVFWKRNFAAAASILEESETKKLVLTFKAAIDFSEPDATMATSISYSQVHKEEAEDTFDNPVPGPELPGEPLGDIDKEAKAETKKLKAKKRKGKAGRPPLETVGDRQPDGDGTPESE
jgi:hypothetical protein